MRLNYQIIQKCQPLNEKIYQLENDACTKPMTAKLFCRKKGIKGYKDLCSVCQLDCHYAVEDSKFNGLPRCENCKMQNRFVQHCLLKFRST